MTHEKCLKKSLVCGKLSLEKVSEGLTNDFDHFILWEVIITFSF